MKRTVDEVTSNMSVYEENGTAISIFRNGTIKECKSYKKVGNFKEIETTAEQDAVINEILGVDPTTDEEVFQKLKSIDIESVLKKKFTKSEKFAKALKIAIDNEENLIVFGPGGYGKSDMIREILTTAGIMNKSFIMSCGEDTDESKLYGGIDIPAMKEGKLRYNIKDSFINYPIVVFEELLDAQVNALLSLKDTLEAREFRKGSQRQKIRTKMVIALTNKSPEEVSQMGPYAEALMQRFRIELEHKWSSHTRQDYLELLHGRFKPSTDKEKKIINAMSGILETISKKKECICPRIAIAATKVALSGGSSSIEDILNNISFVHGLAGMEDTYETMKRDMMINEEQSKIQEAYAKIEDIEDNDNMNNIGKISQLNKIIMTIGRMSVHDESYNAKNNVVERAKNAVNQLASSI